MTALIATENYITWHGLLITTQDLRDFWSRDVKDRHSNFAIHIVGFRLPCSDHHRRGRLGCDSMQLADFMDPIVCDNGLIEGSKCAFRWTPHIRPGDAYDVSRLRWWLWIDPCCDGDWQPFDDLAGTDDACNADMDRILDEFGDDYEV